MSEVGPWSNCSLDPCNLSLPNMHVRTMPDVSPAADVLITTRFSGPLLFLFRQVSVGRSLPPVGARLHRELRLINCNLNYEEKYDFTKQILDSDCWCFVESSLVEGH